MREFQTPRPRRPPIQQTIRRQQGRVEMLATVAIVGARATACALDQIVLFGPPTIEIHIVGNSQVALDGVVSDVIHSPDEADLLPLKILHPFADGVAVEIVLKSSRNHGVPAETEGLLGVGEPAFTRGVPPLVP